ncbi:hypothetical protein Golax_018230, partial [Gossypium laxum]|nr:hypothetical protein [Gossypium laxum]
LRFRVSLDRQCVYLWLV